MIWKNKKDKKGQSIFLKEIRSSNLKTKSRFIDKYKIPLGILLLLCISYGLYYSIIKTVNKREIKLEMLSPEVDIYVLKKSKLEHKIKTPGSVSFLEKASVTSKVMGRIQSLFADQSDNIKKGQKLAQMETFELELRMQNARASSNSALAQLDLAKARYSSSRMNIDKQIQDIERVQSDIIEKKSQYILAKRSLENKQEIYKLGGISKTELKSVYGSYLSASSQYYQARKNYQIKIVGFRDTDLNKSGMNIPVDPIAKRDKFIDFNTQVDKENITVAKAALKNAQIEIESTAMMLRESTIISPIDGVVASRVIEVGEEVKQGEPLFTIVRMDRLLVQTSIPEEDISYLKLGQKVYFNVDARNGIEREGSVYQISPIIDVNTRSTEIKIDAPNSDAMLNPGMFVRCAIVVKHKEDALGIPISYLFEINTSKNIAKAFVYVEGLSLIKEVALGEKFGDTYEVLSGIKPGEQIIASNLQTIKDGMKIKIRKILNETIEADTNE